MEADSVFAEGEIRERRFPDNRLCAKRKHEGRKAIREAKCREPVFTHATRCAQTGPSSRPTNTLSSASHPLHDPRLRKICLVASGPSEWLPIALTSMLRELLKQVVKYNVAMNVVGLANEMPILVIAEGAIILSDRRVDEL